MNLADQECSSYEFDNHPLQETAAKELLREVPQWTLKEKGIERVYPFNDFRQAVEFVNKVAAVAERQNHHPDIPISYNRVTLTLSTHKIGGLSRRDFILAARIDLLIQETASSSKGVG